MTVSNILNLIGLLLNMAGAYMMYYFTPKVSSQVSLHCFDEDAYFLKKDLHKNKMIRLGMLLLFIGFILQAAVLLFTH